MMTSGGAEESRPGMRVSTLQASVFSIVAWATKRATAWTSAAASSHSTSCVATWSTGGPNGFAYSGAFSSVSPGTPSGGSDPATTPRKAPFRAADNSVEVPPGLDVVTAIPRPAPSRRVSGQVMPASSVRPPSNSGTPSARRLSTSTAHSRSTRRRKGNMSRRGSAPATRMVSASQWAVARSPAVPVRCWRKASQPSMSAATCTKRERSSKSGYRGPFPRHQATSKRSRFITLSQAATKSCTNCCSESPQP